MRIDFQSASWHGMRRWAEEQLKRARERNDSPKLTLDETAALRGEIRTYKKLLDLPNAVARGVAIDSGD
jgi:hypothetical protein